jgi:hypothetical protein
VGVVLISGDAGEAVAVVDGEHVEDALPTVNWPAGSPRSSPFDRDAVAHLQLRLLGREVAAVADDLAEPALKLSMTLVVHKVARSSMGNSRSESRPPT